jgi:tetratricopeptide (TPR) repeat protein
VAEFKATPIVHTPRADVRDAVRQELKGLGAEQIVSPGTKDECIELLIANPDAILVLDWECGSEEVNQILGAVKGHFLVEIRPIFLIIPEVDDKVIAVGAEYGVSQVHSGPISRIAIKESLEALLKEDAMSSGIREILVKVAAARSNGDWALATPLLLDIWSKNPGNDRVAFELAENLIYENNWQHAMQLLQPFAAMDPPSTRALHLMGRCLMAQGDYDAAIGLLEKAKIINPHNVDRLIDLGNAFLSNQQVTEAMETFAEASELDPDNKEAKVGQGKCMLMSGEVNEALTLLKAVSGPRELASIFNTAAVLSIRTASFDKGMSLYKSAVKALGRNDKIASRLFYNMGLGYKRWGKNDKALACFEKSFELDATYAKAMKQMEVIKKGGGAATKGASPSTSAHAAKAPAPAAATDTSKGGDFAEEEFTAFRNVGGAAAPAKDSKQSIADEFNADDFNVDD